jgi:hypothetical protein
MFGQKEWRQLLLRIDRIASVCSPTSGVYKRGFLKMEVERPLVPRAGGNTFPESKCRLYLFHNIYQQKACHSQLGYRRSNPMIFDIIKPKLRDEAIWLKLGVKTK